MNYEESIAFIHGKAGKGVKVGLENMRRLMRRLGDPQKQLRCIHVAGTNGKGSTCALIDSVLRQTGAKVGLYTSPYLMRYNERMRIDGQPIADDVLARLTTRIAEQVMQMEETGEGFPTVFEIGTALMFTWFAEQKVDWAVIEVGLGGRLDPTNILEPTVCAITRIGLDHTRVLGDTVEKIAAEKGGIIKDGVPVVLQSQGESVREVIRRICEEKHAPLLDCADFPPQNVQLLERGAAFTAVLPHLRAREYEISLCGAHQVDNAMTALGVLSALLDGHCLPASAIQKGLEQAQWPGRLEWLGNVLIDGAHNPQGAQTVCDYVQHFLKDRRIVLLTGMMADKDVRSYADWIAPLADEIHCVAPEHIPRAMPANELAALYRERTEKPVFEWEETEQALSAAQKSAGEQGVVLICGSLYLAGEIRRLLIAE